MSSLVSGSMTAEPEPCRPGSAVNAIETILIVLGSIVDLAVLGGIGVLALLGAHFVLYPGSRVLAARLLAQAGRAAPRAQWRSGRSAGDGGAERSCIRYSQY